ncbi:hypothetical protein AWB81_07246 [Caballeronia arationis]|nr:hypothetical protein AWB81_07246 [Caballeronia arationis]
MIGSGRPRVFGPIELRARTSLGTSQPARPEPPYTASAPQSPVPLVGLRRSLVSLSGAATPLGKNSLRSERLRRRGQRSKPSSFDTVMLTFVYPCVSTESRRRPPSSRFSLWRTTPSIATPAWHPFSTTAGYRQCRAGLARVCTCPPHGYDVADRPGHRRGAVMYPGSLSRSMPGVRYPKVP